MALSQATLVQRIRFEARDFPWETTGTLTNAADTTLAVTDGTDWAKGDVWEFVEDGDTGLVQSISSNDLTSVRGYYGSTAAGHTAARVMKNPRHFYSEITNAVSSVIQGLPQNRVYKKVADTITPTPGTATWYDLAATALGLISVRQLYGASTTKEGLYGLRHDRRVVFRQNMTTSLAASGVGLSFPDGFYHSSNTINVDYAAKITDAVSGGNYSDLTDGEALTEAIIFGVVSHLEGALENTKPRKPRQDRETLRGAALYDRKYEQALTRAERECRETIPLLPYVVRA